MYRHSNSVTNPLRYSSLKTLTNGYGISLSASSPILSHLTGVQILALFGLTFFTTFTPSLSLRWGGPRQHSQTRRLSRETSSFFTYSLMPCFSSHVTLLVSFCLSAVLGRVFTGEILTWDGQSFKRGMRGFRRTRTDITAVIRACCGKRSRAEALVST